MQFDKIKLESVKCFSSYKLKLGLGDFYHICISGLVSVMLIFVIFFSAAFFIPLSENILEIETDKRNTLGRRNALGHTKQGRVKERNPMMVLKTLKKFLESKKMSKASKKKLQRLIKNLKPLYNYERNFGGKVRSIVV